MSYTVSMFLNGKKVVDAPFKVKHFRQYEGRNVNPKGGHTVIFDLQYGEIYSSKCRGDEHFSRHKGVLTCLQKMLDVVTLEDNAKFRIINHKFYPNGVEIHLLNEKRIVDSNTLKKFYWL